MKKLLLFSTLLVLAFVYSCQKDASALSTLTSDETAVTDRGGHHHGPLMPGDSLHLDSLCHHHPLDSLGHPNWDSLFHHHWDSLGHPNWDSLFHHHIDTLDHPHPDSTNVPGGPHGPHGPHGGNHGGGGHHGGH